MKLSWMFLGLVALAIVVALFIWFNRDKDISPRDSPISGPQQRPDQSTMPEVSVPGFVDVHATYDPDNIVQVQSIAGGCLALPDGNNGTRPVLSRHCSTADTGQRWRYDANTKQLQNANGSCLERSLRGWVCDSEDVDQRWTYSNATRQFVHKDGSCLSVDGKGGLEVQACRSEEQTQQWKVTRVGGRSNYTWRRTG